MTTKTFTNISPQQPIEPKIEFGQVYLHKPTNELYIVSNADSIFALICLADGVSYAGPFENIEDVFGSCKDSFVLVKEIDIKYSL